MNNIPFISIIMPCFNGENYLRKAIESFIAQDYPLDKKELIIVGNKSTDCSNEIIKEFVDSYSNIKWIEIADRGISHASNEGVANAKGEIIGKLGADDFYLENIFKRVAYFYQLLDWDAVYFNAYSYYPVERKCLLHRCPEWELNHVNLIRKGVVVGGEDIFYKSEILKMYKFNEANKYCMDYELMLDITKRQKFLAFHIDETCSVHHFDGNITSDMDGKQLRELYEVVNKFASSPSENYFSMYFPNSISKTDFIEIGLFPKIYLRFKSILKSLLCLK